MRAYALALGIGLAAVPACVRGAETAAKAQTISVIKPWLRATPHAAPVIGGYVTLKNTGRTPDRLIGATLPVAPNGEVHTMSMSGGMMHMRRLDDGLEIKPGETVTLEPGGNHLMFLKPTAQIKEGESVKGTLSFAKAGTVAVTFAVGGMAAKSAPAAAR